VGWVEGDVYGQITWDDGGGGTTGGSGCQCVQTEVVCSPIINCIPGDGCSRIEDCRTVCVRQECWV
jgi:hypothetical protein